MPQNLRERIATALLVASVAISAYIAWQVTDMPKEQGSGQIVRALAVKGEVSTERFVGESLEVWIARHDEAIEKQGGLAKRDR